MPDVEVPVVPDGVASVLSVLRSSAVLVGADDTVLKASAPAYAMGLVSGTSLMSASWPSWSRRSAVTARSRRPSC